MPRLNIAIYQVCGPSQLTTSVFKVFLSHLLQIPPQLSSLPAMLTAACPFGTPIDTDLCQLSLNRRNSIGSGTVNDRPTPAWRPIGSRGKAAASAVVTEWVRAVQYGRRDVPDAWEVYGCITSKVFTALLCVFCFFLEKKIL